jgi:cytochrome c biogenesis protein CcdA
VNRELVGLAFGAGLVAALNPCGFAMLPAYLALVVRGEQRRQFAAAGRALAATAAMAAGFVAVFGGFGLLTVSAASVVQRYLPYVTVAVGFCIVAVGIWLLMGRQIVVDVPKVLSRWSPTGRLGSMFTYGVGYAVASLSCTAAPFLAVTGVGLRGGSAIGVIAIYLAYAAGFTVVVGALAVAAAMASSVVVDRMRRIVPHLNAISGVLLVGVGLYVGYYGLYEVRLVTVDGNPRDPVIAAAAHLQGAIAGWIHQHGGWPWVVGLAVLLAAGSGARAWVRTVRCRRADPATAADGSSPAPQASQTPSQLRCPSSRCDRRRPRAPSWLCRP